MNLEMDESDEILEDSEEDERGDRGGFDPSRLLTQKGLTPLAREILSRMYGVPYVNTEKGGNNEVKVDENEMKEAQAIDESKEELRKLNPCSADYAEDYLRARQYETQEGLRLRNHRGQWLRFNGASYEPVSEKELRVDVMNYFTGTCLRGMVKKSFVSGVIDHLEAKCLIPEAVSLPALIAEGQWYEEPGMITLQNGVIELGNVRNGITPRLQEHKPEWVSKSMLPYDYDPKARCPHWLTFLEQVLPDEGSRRLLQQIFGYCLTRDMSLQKFFMFEGTGRNGKSVVTGILRRLVGTHNASGLPLNRFHDKHGLVNTYGKLVNFAGELREKDAVAEDLLKQATGGDLMHFDQKYQKPFAAPFTAKIIICTNERPAFTDRSDGLWRRLIILLFPISVPPEKQDPGLEEKLALELAGIMNWALAGTVSLYKAGRFEEPQVSIDARTDFQKDANPARQFFDEYCRLEPKGFTESQVLYDRYQAYVQERGHKPLSETKFKKEVEALTGEKKVRRYMPDDSRPNIYPGIVMTCRTMPQGM